jgi:excisionase family DNA binding protein
VTHAQGIPIRLGSTTHYATEDDLRELARLLVEHGDLLTVAPARETPLPPLMTTAEVADYLRCTPDRVRHLVHQRKLPRHKDATRNLYRREDVEAYVRDVVPAPSRVARRASWRPDSDRAA